MRKSAGILLYRLANEEIEILLVHPGGPFWKNKEIGAWSIPKGEYSESEDPLIAAIREMKEETGFDVKGPFIPLSFVKQKAGKQVIAWAAFGDFDASAISSNTFSIQWPYKSGKWITVPEIDKAGWFTLELAKALINPAQVSFIDELILYINETLNKKH